MSGSKKGRTSIPKKDGPSPLRQEKNKADLAKIDKECVSLQVSSLSTDLEEEELTPIEYFSWNEECAKEETGGGDAPMEFDNNNQKPCREGKFQSICHSGITFSQRKKSHTGRLTPSSNDEETPPSSPRPSLSGSTHHKSQYHMYLVSKEFAVDNPPTIIEKCYNYSRPEPYNTKSFWDQNYALLKKWIDAGKISELRNFCQVIPDGTNALRYFMMGFEAGRSFEKSDIGTKLITEVGQQVDTLTLITSEVIQEASAHRAQNVEHFSQMREFSKNLSQMIQTFEQSKLITLKAQTMPGLVQPTKIHTIPEDADDSETDSQTSTSYEVQQASVRRLRVPGVYQSSYGIIKISNKVVQSIDAKVTEFSGLKCLTGKPVELASYVLNRNLKKLMELCARDIKWLEKCLPPGKKANKEGIIEILRPIPLSDFQWTERDVDIPTQ